MYRIIKDGEIIAIVEKPRFIHLHGNGSFVETDEEHAQGIAVNSIPYNLPWREPMDGVKEAVTYSEVNGGEYLLQNQNAINDLDAMVVELEYQSLLRGLGVVENVI